MRSEIGKMDLDTTFRERDTLNEKILDVLSLATSEWGIKCLRYEIKDI
jgi:regulator of protease activity HflC (stomatin/prohibitin superfamily)